MPLCQINRNFEIQIQLIMPVTDLSQLDTQKLYSYADYLLWQVKERIELIKGKVYKMSPAPGTEHQRISHELDRQFGNYFHRKPCQVFPAPFDVRFPRKGEIGDELVHTVVQPDLCVICDPAKLDERGCKGAPDLVVEILSPGNFKKEMRDKFEVYEEAGVREYWLVNPSDKTVFIFVLNDQWRFIGLQPLTEDQKGISTIFPELEIDLNEVFNP